MRVIRRVRGPTDWRTDRTDSLSRLESSNMSVIHHRKHRNICGSTGVCLCRTAVQPTISVRYICAHNYEYFGRREDVRPFPGGAPIGLETEASASLLLHLGPLMLLLCPVVTGVDRLF